MRKITLKLALLFISSISFAQTNLADSSGWTVGTGSVSGFNVYQDDTTENERVSGTDAYGNTSVLWKGIPSGNGLKDGGWTRVNVNIDHTKAYRFTVWFKKTSSHEGDEIFGFRSYDSASEKVTLNLDGSNDNTPWFSFDDMPQLDTWYLMVGFVHASNDSSTTHLGAMYATDGTMVRSLTDYKFPTTAIKMGERNILWDDDLGVSEMFFWNPTIYEVNGQEPTILELLNLSGGADTQAPTSTVLSSTGQTDTTADLSWSGATDNIGVTGYKIFKDGSLEATLGNVSTYEVTGLTETTTHQFTISALDAALNESTLSNIISVTTDATSGGGGGSSSGNWTLSSTNLYYDEGNVGIGTNNIPSAYKLAVNGKIISEEVKVQLQSQWADYVFAKDYELPTLEEVEKHIKERGHLINIPSAQEVEANGIQLGEMNKLLLEKIEELTLYLLKQQKEIDSLNTKVKILQQGANKTP